MPIYFSRLKTASVLLALLVTLTATGSVHAAQQGEKAETEKSGNAQGEDASGCCPMMREGMDGEGMMMGPMMGSQPMMGDMMRDMGPIHELLAQHEKIERRVKNIPNGIESWTESDDPEVARLIQTHVWQMKERVEQGRPIRMMDPVFREIFENHDKIQMDIENTEKGVHVKETSDHPEVVKLIRQHAHRAVSEFVDEGMSRAMRPTELPSGYSDPSESPRSSMGQ